ncbi:hypothetical protein [Helicobacter pylori]|uniref:hypothetical protein n=1 Tax=Helicobacter pylori TaxID=210 RepID=UPI0015E6846C|nr:hypothetical protein [Helicobacter pylori]
MDLRSLENALNSGDFKEQVYRSLEGIYQISNVLNQLELENFNQHDLEIVAKIQAIKNTLEGYEISEQELKAKINALVNSLEAKKQELEARLNMELQTVRNNEIQKLNEAGNALKADLVAKLTEVKDNLALGLLEKLKASTQSPLNTPQIQGVTKFLGFYIYGYQNNFKVNLSDNFNELFEFDTHLKANKSYLVQFKMPYELSTDGIYSNNMGEMVLCLKANNSVYPIINSFYQNKTANLIHNYKIIDTYSASCVFKTPSEQADYKIGVFARKYKDLWVNVNYTSNTQGFQTNFLNNAHFSNLTTQSLPTDYNNNMVFYKHSQALIYEILE